MPELLPSIFDVLRVREQLTSREGYIVKMHLECARRSQYEASLWTTPIFLSVAVAVCNAWDVSQRGICFVRAQKLHHGTLALTHYCHVKIMQKCFGITRGEGAACHQQPCSRAEMLCKHNTLFLHRDHTVNPYNFGVGPLSLFKRCFSRHEGAIQNIHIVSSVLQTCGNVTDS